MDTFIKDKTQGTAQGLTVGQERPGNPAAAARPAASAGRLGAPVTIGPVTEEFNPAEFVYKDDDGNRVLDLDARMAWFYHLKRGWKITIDGLRVFAMEVYVNNTYAKEDPEGSVDGEYVTMREKENIFVAVGFISMLDENGVRVTSVPMNVDASDPDFCGKLFELGTQFILDMTGFNIYNISRQQWAQAYEKRLRLKQADSEDEDGREWTKSRQLREKAEAAAPVSRAVEVPEQAPQAPAPKKEKKTKLLDDLIPDKAPMGIGIAELSGTLDFAPAPEPKQEGGLPDPEDIQGMMDYYNSSLPEPLASADLLDGFNRFCIYRQGCTYQDMEPGERQELREAIGQKIKSNKAQNAL